MAGLALTGAAIPAAVYTPRQLIRVDEPVTPGEASVDLPDTEGIRLADKLRGLWDVRFFGRDAGLAGLPAEGVELLLDVAPRGRGLTGCLGLGETLRGPGEAEFRVLGNLSGSTAAEVRWQLFGRGEPGAMPSHECLAVLDEVWDLQGEAGSATLSGRLRRLDVPLSAPEADCRFVAHKRPFPVARERIGLSPALLDWLVSPQHRLFHQLWHATRDKWHRLPENKREALRGIGWQPGPRGEERDARGPIKHRNGSGVDFFFMHRHMLMKARSLQPLPSWTRLPLPVQPLEYDRLAFARYFDNQDGFSVPPAWVATDDDDLSEWLHDIKSAETYHSNFQVWESRYRDPQYLATLTLGAFGSEMELGMHDWLHMRWASVTRDPSNDMPVMGDRDPVDFASRWFRPENDFLGDPFSSHVNPVFWHFHGWIDDRLDDWFRAHQRYHPGEVVPLEVNGVPWFAPGRWVEVNDPWLGASTHGCGDAGAVPGPSMENDVETMKLALRITFSGDSDVPDLLRRTPRRPWYARNLRLSRR